MESVTLKGTRALIIPIICAMMLNGGNFTFNITSKASKSNNKMELYNEVIDFQDMTLEFFLESELNAKDLSKKSFLIKHKDLLKKNLTKQMSVIITGDKEELKPYVLECIYDNKVTIKFDEEKLDKKEVKLVANTIDLENGGSVEVGFQKNDRDGIDCGLLTGSVVLNRAYFCKWCPDTIEGVLYQKGQYASHTTRNLDSHKATKECQLLAKFLLIFGPTCPENVVYQSQNSRLGSKLYRKIKTTSGYEYFAYE